MPSTCSSMKGGRRRRTSRRSHKRSRRGGSSSAATYALGQVGTSDTQVSNANSSPVPGLPLTNFAGESVSGYTHHAPSASSLALVQSAGKKHRRRGRRGGSLIDIVGQAAVPFGLLGLQQTFSRRKRSGKHGGKSRRHSRRHRRR